MRNIFFLLIILTLMISACKTSKPSLYQPPVNQVSVEEEPKVNIPVKNIPETPIVMKTEEVTLADEKNVGDKMFDFYVILGSFELQKNANELHKQLVSEGNSSVVLKSGSGMYRVAVKGTNSEFEARKLIGEIRVKSPEHHDVWLLKKK